jgi:hypothetical protein
VGAVASKVRGPESPQAGIKGVRLVEPSAAVADLVLINCHGRGLAPKIASMAISAGPPRIVNRGASLSANLMVRAV